MKLESIIAPLIVLAVTVLLLVVGRFYERLPVKLPPCGFKRITGLPCVSCRGTRSVQALTKGKVRLAFRYNPLVVVALGIGFTWIAGYAVRKGRPPRRPISQRFAIITTVVLLLLNWIYLILTNHHFP